MRLSASSTRPSTNEIQARCWSAQASPRRSPASRDRGQRSPHGVLGVVVLAEEDLGHADLRMASAAPCSSPSARKWSTASASVPMAMARSPLSLDLAPDEQRPGDAGLVAELEGEGVGLLDVGTGGLDVAHVGQHPARPSSSCTRRLVRSGPSRRRAWLWRRSATEGPGPRRPGGRSSSQSSAGRHRGRDAVDRAQLGASSAAAAVEGHHVDEPLVGLDLLADHVGRELAMPWWRRARSAFVSVP